MANDPNPHKPEAPKPERPKPEVPKPQPPISQLPKSPGPTPGVAWIAKTLGARSAKKHRMNGS